MSESVADIARKFDSLVASAFAANAPGVAGPASLTTSSSANVPTSAQPAAQRDTAEANLLFFWPMALTNSYAKTLVAKILYERAMEDARSHVAVTAPRAGTTCGLQMTSRCHAEDLLGALPHAPIDLIFQDASKSAPRADFAKPERQSVRGRVFKLVYVAT